MATLELQEGVIKYAIDEALGVVSSKMLSISKNKVPRDWNRPPKPIPSLKSGNAPQRNVRKGNKRYYRPPITKNGQYYEGVTGNLKRSLLMEKTDDFEYSVGVQAGPTEEYGKAQEFGTSIIPARSYLREPFEENQAELLAQFQKTFQEIIDNF